MLGDKKKTRGIEPRDALPDLTFTDRMTHSSSWEFGSVVRISLYQHNSVRRVRIVGATCGHPRHPYVLGINFFHHLDLDRNLLTFLIWTLLASFLRTEQFLSKVNVHSRTSLLELRFAEFEGFNCTIVWSFIWLHLRRAFSVECGSRFHWKYFIWLN